MKAMYINDCQCNFIDNEEKLIFSFRSPNNRPITLLDIRKLQVASMIKGGWCESFEEIASYLSSLHQVDSHGLGRMVEFFKLFDNNSDELISYLPSDIWVFLSMIATSSGNFDSFLIEEFEKNELLWQSIKGFHPYWKNLKYKGIHTFLDLVNFTRSDLLQIRNIGSKTVNEIEALLAEKGLHLKEEKK